MADLSKVLPPSFILSQVKGIQFLCVFNKVLLPCANERIEMKSIMNRKKYFFKFMVIALIDGFYIMTPKIHKTLQAVSFT
jgi:hypothetical protein